MITVRIKDKVFYKDTMYNKGDVIKIRNESEFTARGMEKIADQRESHVRTFHPSADIQGTVGEPAEEVGDYQEDGKGQEAGDPVTLVGGSSKAKSTKKK